MIHMRSLHTDIHIYVFNGAGMAPPDGKHETFYGTFPNGTNFSAAYETFDTERCVRHAMGHADAVEPLTRFLLKYL